MIGKGFLFSFRTSRHIQGVVFKKRTFRQFFVCCDKINNFEQPLYNIEQISIVGNNVLFLPQLS